MKSKNLLKKVKLRTWIALGVILLLIPIAIVALYSPRESFADWFNDSWAYRQPFSFTHNADISTESRITFSLDTAELIAAGVMQSDCDDTRFTNLTGLPLRYELTGTCNNAATTYEVVFPTIINGTNSAYVYYGNPGANSGSSEVDSIVTELTPSGGDPALTDRTAEQKGETPQLYIPFNEGFGTNANDTTTGNNDGTLSGGTSWHPEDRCLSGKCVTFDGSDDVVTVTQTGRINLSGELAAAFTIEAWVKVSSDGENNVGQIFQKGTNNYLRITNDGADGLSDLEASIDLATSAATVTITDGITRNVWTHIAVSYTDDGDDEITIWLNGATRGTSTNGSGAPASDANDLLIGGSSSANYHGFVDEFKMYKQEKTASQIKTQFASKGAEDGVSASFGKNELSFVSQGLVGYWPLDEVSTEAGTVSRADMSGNGNTLTDNNTTPSGGGKYTNGVDIEFSDTNEDLSIADASHNGLDITSTITVSAWVRLESNNSRIAGIVGKGTDDTGVANAYILSHSSANPPVPRFQISSSGGTLYTQSGTTTLSNATWYHLVGTYDGAHLRIYVNGDEENTAQAVVTDIRNNSDPLEIGRAFDGGVTNYHFDGLIDDVRIYNRGLSSSEVSLLYTHFGPTPGAHYKLDDNTGTTAADTSTNENTTSTFGGNTTWAKGRFGSALTFDGNADVAQVTESASIDLGLTTQSFTAMGWVKTSTNSAAAQTIVAKDDGSGSYSFSLFLNSTELPCFQISDGTNAPSTCGTTALDDGVWHHLAGKRDVITDLVYIYVDGSLVDSSADSTTATVQTNDNIGIGNSGTSYAAFDLTGEVDDVKIYGYARTPEMIIEDMNAGHPVGGSPIGSQVIYYNFNKATGNTIANYRIYSVATNGFLTDGTWASKENCRHELCIDFDGVDDVVSTSNSDLIDLNVGLANGFTVSAWIYPDTAGEGSGGRVFTKNANTWLRVDTLSGGLLDIQGSLDLATDATLNVAAAVTQSAWNHVALSWTDDSDDEITIWVNGKAVGTSTNGVGVPAADTATLMIGNDVLGDTSETFDGRIDEFKVYATELTAEQMAINRNNSSVLAFGAGLDEASQVTGGVGNLPHLDWRFDDNVGSGPFDYSGNLHIGTFANSASFSDGKYGFGMRFAGSNQHVTLADNSDLDFAAAESFTIETWFRHGAATATETIASKIEASGTDGGYKIKMESDGDITCEIEDSDADTTIDDTISSTAATYDDNKWHHTVCVKNGTTSLTLYIDGLQVAQDAALDASNTLANDDAFFYAIESASGSEDYVGQLDHLQIYRYARTLPQVAYDFNRGNALAQWRFDECSGPTAFNAGSSGSALDGTLTPGASGNDASGNCTSGDTTEMRYNGATGKYNASLDFDGTDDYVTIPDNSTLDVGSTDDKTFSFWFNRDTFNTSDAILSKFNTGGTVGYYISISSADTLSITFLDAESDVYSYTTTQTFTTSGWNHVVVVWDEDSEANSNIYINGNLGTVTRGGTIGDIGNMSHSDPFQIGIFLATEPFDGKIDDMRVYNYALSEDQIKKLYNENSSARFGPATGMP